jgi:diadenosine tetraphosphate (Ap4A) HIT family hydrolase
MFTLHPRLSEETFLLGDFALSRLLLMNDANYPWFILVPRRLAIREIHELSEVDQQQLLKESSHLARQLEDVFKAEKLNIAALGNLVPQLHLHHVVRYSNDACWPAPVWGKCTPVAYSPERVQEIRQRLLGKLADFSTA